MNVAVATACPTCPTCPALNFTTFLKGTDSKINGTTFCQGVGKTVASCQTDCMSNYSGIPQDTISNGVAPKTLSWFKSNIPVAISLNISGTPLANLRDCCKVYNNNTVCDV